MADYKKLTINIAADLHDELQRAAAERGITVTELIRRAIALDKFIHDNSDSELLLRKGDEVRQIVRV